MCMMAFKLICKHEFAFDEGVFFVRPTRKAMMERQFTLQHILQCRKSVMNAGATYTAEPFMYYIHNMIASGMP